MGVPVQRAKNGPTRRVRRHGRHLPSNSDGAGGMFGVIGTQGESAFEGTFGQVGGL